MKKIIKLIRPHQWLKNTFVFFPMFFGGSLMCTEDIMAAVITFFAFSFTASSIYCLNDIIDVDADRKHPKKCNRPIASGAISIPTAYTLMLLLAVAGFATCLLLTINALATMCIIVGYWLLNVLYCTKLKDYAIIDVCIIAFGFVLRILAGATATETIASHWLVLMTFLLTLFLSFAKRRDDVLRMNATGSTHLAPCYKSREQPQRRERRSLI